MVTFEYLIIRKHLQKLPPILFIILIVDSCVFVIHTLVTVETGYKKSTRSITGIYCISLNSSLPPRIIAPKVVYKFFSRSLG